MPSMHFENNCSAEELIEFADRIKTAEQTNSAISFSKKEMDNLRDYGSAFVIYLTKYKQLTENTVIELVELINKYIKPSFSEKELSECICCAQIYLYHVVNSIKKINKNYVIKGYELCLLKYVDSTSEFYKYLKDTINAKGYESKCDYHYDKLFVKKNANRSNNIPICIRCQNKICFGRGCTIIPPKVTPIKQDKINSPKKKNNYKPEKSSTKNKYNNQINYKKIRHHLRKIMYNTAKVNNLIDGEKNTNNNSVLITNQMKYLLLMLFVFMGGFFILNFFTFGNRYSRCSYFTNIFFRNRCYQKYRSYTLLDRILAVFFRPY